jgi:hypothetical protein
VIAGDCLEPDRRDGAKGLDLLIGQTYATQVPNEISSGPGAVGGVLCGGHRP